MAAPLLTKKGRRRRRWGEWLLPAVATAAAAAAAAATRDVTLNANASSSLRALPPFLPSVSLHKVAEVGQGCRLPRIWKIIYVNDRKKVIGTSQPCDFYSTREAGSGANRAKAIAKNPRLGGQASRSRGRNT